MVSTLWTIHQLLLEAWVGTGGKKVHVGGMDIPGEEYCSYEYGHEMTGRE